MVTKTTAGMRNRTYIKSGKTSFLSKHLPLLLMCLPGAALLFVFNYLPLYGLQLAFRKWHAVKGIWGSDFVGLRNFKYFIESIYFWRITRNTIGYNLVFIISLLVASLIVAILLNEVRSKWQLKYYQTSMIFAQFLSWVIVAYMAYAFFSESYGILNNILRAAGLSEVQWYTNIEPWPFILVFFNIWKNVGYFSLIYYAGIIGIDTSYYEAARIDGASKLMMTRKITIPLLTPQIILILLISIGKIFYSDFGLFFQVPMNVGMLLPATEVMDYYIFRMLRMTQNIDISAAAGFYQSIMGFAMVFLSNLFIRKISPENSLF